MYEEKIKLNEDLLEGLSNMLISPSSDDVDIAATVLDNRDKDDLESEKWFKELGKRICSNSKLFPVSNRFAIKINDQILTVNGKIGFASEAEALTQLSKHLTKFIGTEKANVSHYDKRIILENFMKTKYPQEQNLASYGGYDSKHRRDYQLLLAKTVTTDEYKKHLKEQIIKIHKQHVEDTQKRLKSRDPYLYTLRLIFKSGNKLRDYLYYNKLIQIIQIK